MQNFTRILTKVLIPDYRILEAIDVIRNRGGPPDYNCHYCDCFASATCVTALISVCIYTVYISIWSEGRL